MTSRSQRADRDVSRHHRIKAEQEDYVSRAPSKQLLTEIRERVMPILTHEREASTMSVPADYARDDDLFVMIRIVELLRRNP